VVPQPERTEWLSPGDVVDDRFVVEAAASKGGFGVVFKGWDLELEIAVAIKVLASVSTTDVARFDREAGLLAALRAPGLVRHVHHGVLPGGAPYLVMEWLEGETVARRMEQTGFTVAEAVALVRAACAPLAELHARGLVHRDLKPENLFLTGPAPTDVVLIDLGLARAAAAGEVRVTATGVVLGTPGYMAPEQVRGDASVDARADVFALGCVLYELVTGYPAFAGENYLAVRSKILLAAPPRLRALCPEAPHELEAIVGDAIAKRRDERPASAAALAAGLAALADLPSATRRRWNLAPPATAKPDPALRAPAGAAGATVEVGAWSGVALVHAEDTNPLDVAQVVGRIGGRVEILDGGGFVITVPPARALPELAVPLTRAALYLLARFPDARITVSCGTGAIEELIDQAGALLDRATRATLLERTARPGDPIGFAFVDAATAGALTADFQLERRPSGYCLIGVRDGA
jgi:hypothetical protein